MHASYQVEVGDNESWKVGGGCTSSRFATNRGPNSKDKVELEHVLDKSHQDMTAYEQVTLDDEDVGVSDNEETPYS